MFYLEFKKIAQSGHTVMRDSAERVPEREREMALQTSSQTHFECPSKSHWSGSGALNKKSILIYECMQLLWAQLMHYHDSVKGVIAI